ncbi:MAG: hypothetical protein ACFFB5_20620 [Promethearchaeota archaeon]
MKWIKLLSCKGGCLVILGFRQFEPDSHVSGDYTEEVKESFIDQYKDRIESTSCELTDLCN